MVDAPPRRPLNSLSLYCPPGNGGGRRTDNVVQCNGDASENTRRLLLCPGRECTENTHFSSSSSSEYSFQLHTRLSVGESLELEGMDYRTLVAARVGRDSARVRSLQTRAAAAYQQREAAYQEESNNPAHGVPVISGVSQGSGDYFARLKIGSPGREFYLIADTGSDLTWLQCQPCSSCYKQADPIFNPTQSSTYSPLACDAHQCQSLQTSGSCNIHNNQCSYDYHYGDNSSTVGEVATESVAFGRRRSASRVPIGCGHDNEGLFAGAAGILGLSRGPLSFPSQIINSGGSFSYCLVDRDSTNTSTLDFGSSLNQAPPPGDAVVVARLIPRGDIFYHVDLIGISVGGLRMIPIINSAYPTGGGGAVIIDSGTAITRLHADAYDSLRLDFLKAAANLTKAATNDIFDTCFDFSNEESVRVPTLSFHFTNPGNELELPAENYLIPVDSSGTFCLAFFSTSSSLSIIGNVQQQRMRVTYDLHNSQLLFHPEQC